MKKTQKFGYIRVSSKDQNEQRQYLAMRQYGIADGNIYLDKLSGKNFQRKAYQQLLQRLRPGDLLVVKSIDRLGRNYAEILEQWRFLTKEKQITVSVLDMPLLNTDLERDLTGTLIADIVLQLLSYVAETERAFIRQRQAEGIAAAKARGIRFGRRALPVPPEFHRVFNRWQEKEINSRQAASFLHVSQYTFLKWARNVQS